MSSPERLREKLHRFKEAVSALAALEVDLPHLKRSIPTMLEKGHPERDAAVQYYKSAAPVFVRALRTTYAKVSGSGNVFYEILQTYTLPPDLRKKVEQASKFYTRYKYSDPAPKQEAKVYEQVLQQYRMHLMWYETAIEQGDPMVPAKVGSFSLVNIGGFGHQRVQDVSEVLLEAERRLSLKGLSKVCYGEAFLSNDLLKPNVIAFYLPARDEMFLRGDLRHSAEEQVKTVIHELAHRLHDRFLKHRDFDVTTLYHWVAQGARKGESPFITPYAKTNPSENFAEMVSAWCFDLLPSSQESRLLSLVAP